MSDRLRLRPLLLLLGLITSPSCDARGEVRVAWEFADGRACAEAGAAQMVLFVVGKRERPPEVHRCSEGQEGRAVALREIAPDDIIEVQAVSLAGGLLYLGSARAPARAEVLLLVLRFVGGR